MPRLLDKLDAATGLTPSELESSVDYLSQQPGPDAVVGPDGRYNAGWFSDFQGRLNFSDSRGLDLAFQQWIHLSFDTPRHFLICNIADLGRAGNIALLVVDKQTGRFHHASLTRIFPRNSLTVTDAHRCFRDPESGSSVTISPDGTRFVFSVHAEALHLAGVARTALGPPLVQITRFQRGRGSLQRYGALEIEHGSLTLEGDVLPLPPGALGTYDHTIGHQRGIQAWNWIAAAGQATCVDTGETQPLALQVARDREAARPRVEGLKNVVWLDGLLHKIPSARFAYAYTDPETRATGGWTLDSPDRDPERGLDLHFSPLYHRREKRFLWVMSADFNQYYGELSGTVVLGGRTWRLDRVFAVTEESLLEL